MNQLGAPHQEGRPRVVAFGGAKGGAGRSTLCAEIARSLARHGQRVLCVDGSWECATLNTLLHAEESRFEFSESLMPLGLEGSHIADYIQATGYRNVWHAALASGRDQPYLRPRLAGDILLAQCHELDFDWVFFDLPPSVDPFPVTVFALCDVPLLICTPEPASIRLTTQFMRAAIYQAIGFHPDARDHANELLETLYQQPLMMNRDSLLRAAPSPDCRRIIGDTLDRFEAYLVVNMVREGAERDLGAVLCHALHQALGVFPRFVGSVDFEDRRWFYNRRTAGGGNSVRGEEALSNDIETLARHLGDLRVIDAKYPRPVPRQPDAHPARKIGLSAETGRNEIRQTCRRLWEGYRRENAISLVFVDPERRLQIADQLENTYRKVLTLTSDAHEAPPTPPAPAPDPPRAERIPERSIAKTEPPSTTPPKPKSSLSNPGKTIETLRKQRQMSLQDLSLRTHIGIKYLSAIEDGDVEILPRPVYLRGYLREIARVFDVESEQLIEEYFRFLSES
ncbi:MAG: helix-turn-helix domain-containing protein [bacterium]